MINEVFNITRFKNGKVYISPLSMQNNGKYLIECNTEEEADNLRSRLGEGHFPTPLQDSSKYEEINKIRNNGETTIIYRVKSCQADRE